MVRRPMSITRKDLEDLVEKGLVADIFRMEQAFELLKRIGERSKDFIDIYYLLSEFRIEKMLEFYQEKYNQQNTSFILKSLIYFKDVDPGGWPVLIKNPKLNWKDIRKRIEKEVLEYIHHL